MCCRRWLESWTEWVETSWPSWCDTTLYRLRLWEQLNFTAAECYRHSRQRTNNSVLNATIRSLSLSLSQSLSLSLSLSLSFISSLRQWLHFRFDAVRLAFDVTRRHAQMCWSWGVWGSWLPLKICRRGSEYVLTPPKRSHSFIFKTVVASFTSLTMKDLGHKMEGKTKFSRRLQAVRNRDCWAFGLLNRRGTAVERPSNQSQILVVTTALIIVLYQLPRL